ncbi:FAD-dependent oxidoreductase [Bordetella pseudohinzii]|uniref:3-(3-hydroxy-phenyl)propionate/3-hydroxycinnamic acid hydroxylase n=1 Tax=Bordetella pseudohinzii TaxID=1331258 RepID=A0A0J6EU86_9BORD|nr:FAD-dependent oxidoreductase [Bordetella pseudohinzii]ANY17621.1 FAD-dependent oxidoreductase [Bordetella pseudohinzii]KMM24005.1 FAD-dependent oxidoreductase [Bordetella pseudohinzii]KXA76016.1 FAD-dependent oxidoreductase [Bordetella pseudohinzii]KXA81835.1 FAD-dependent oxidoreductase [Bordetella pseudohinzii]CUI75279.1 3-(3-hydroxy-phenyl)propionate/3-hydroxycinnamic acid hydroxylase [Bordetella pseudohinzii]
MGDIDYQALEFAYQACADQQPGASAAHRAVIVGAGPVGLSTALDLARRGTRVIVLDDDCRLSTGSRAICFSKRTLEIWDRLGVGQRMVDKGVSWNVGKVFFREGEVWRFDLLPESGHRRPAFINLQQYYAEGYLLEAARAEPNIELRWKNKVTGVTPRDAGVTVDVDTPDGPYALQAEWLIACDGARSPVRKLLGQEAHGRIFKDRFLIADVKMSAPFPAERWFWFDPPFHPNQSVLLHMQPDNVWRIDFQLGWNADPVEAVKPANVLPRIRALLGPDTPFELEWVSVYTFACERMDRFRHGRVLFAGDAAHRVSPFGARGANSGVQDAENLAWKLQLVLDGHAPDRLIDSYASEREYAADENILNSSRSTDFITPKSEISRNFRNAVLNLARDHAFARGLVNSGRLSLPARYADSPLNTPDAHAFAGAMLPGSVAADAPVADDAGQQWWLQVLDGGFTLAWFGGEQAPDARVLADLRAVADSPLAPRIVLVRPAGASWQAPAGTRGVSDTAGLLAARYDARPGSCYLIRPDQHIAARRRDTDATALRAALARAAGQS